MIYGRIRAAFPCRASSMPVFQHTQCPAALPFVTTQSSLPPCLPSHPHHTTLQTQEFFRCDYFIDAGAAGLLLKLGAAVDRTLGSVDFGGCMTPQVRTQVRGRCFEESVGLCELTTECLPAVLQLFTRPPLARCTSLQSSKLPTACPSVLAP